MLWWTASKWTGYSKSELVQYRLESEREGNPEQQKGKYGSNYERPKKILHPRNGARRLFALLYNPAE